MTFLKKLISLVLFCVAFQCFSIHTNRVTFNGNHFIHLTSPKNTKVLFFLHGGVSNPYFKNNKVDVSLSFILENNSSFAEMSLANGYDLILPITNDSLNWVSNPGYCFNMFRDFKESLSEAYNEHYISGFSDGGTGSFKIFYSNPEYFHGLIVFNGYPFHKNFASSVDYTQVTSKKVVFFGTEDDQTTPYEFMLIAYSKQKVINSDTYLYVTKGKHSFKYYTEKDFKELFDILKTENENFKHEPIQGYIRHDELIEFYEFKKSIVRKYSIGQEYYEMNKQQQKELPFH